MAMGIAIRLAAPDQRKRPRRPAAKGGGCQVIAKIDCLPHSFWAIHFCCLPPLSLPISPLVRLLSVFWRCLKHHLALHPDAVGAELLTVKRIAVQVGVRHLELSVVAVEIVVDSQSVFVNAVVREIRA